MPLGEGGPPNERKKEGQTLGANASLICRQA